MHKKVSHGTTWGDWKLDAETANAFTLVLNSDRHHYEVPVDRITSSAQMLDWIFQLRTKTWVTNEILGDLLSAFQDLLRPQTFLCGAGKDKKFDAETHLRKILS